MTIKPSQFPPGTRWTPQRKLDTLIAYDLGKITLSDLAQHSISFEELEEWRALYVRGGKRALRATSLQRYRSK